MARITTLPELLEPRGADPAIALFRRPGEYERLTASELRARALARLGAFQRAGFAPADELVMPIEDAGELLTAFWAAVLGGMRPMPLAAPANDATCAKVIDVLERLPRARLVVDDAGWERLARHAAAAGRTAAIDALAARRHWPRASGEPGRPHPARPEDIAFVQFSSGSTRAPKGVTLRHRNVVANLAALAAGVELGPRDVTLSWMPLSHDMGLVGFHLAPLFAGAAQVVLPTQAFARSPLLWLQAASEERATILSSPNFGYRHVLKALERKAPGPIDLSRVRLIFNGAEPISVELASRFLDRTASFGLRREAMFPVYGLAEATLGVTFPRLGETIHGAWLDRRSLSLGGVPEPAPEGSRNGIEVCATGRPVAGCEVRIAGADGGASAPGAVGRILIRGANVTEGYYRGAGEAEDALDAEGWLDTGDLGFLRAGELYVTGRTKDLVIVAGQNFYPHDLEESLAKGLELDPLRLAVTSARRGGEEELVLFVQHRQGTEGFLPLADRARLHLAEAFGLALEHVVPVDAIPRTTSGKVQRHALAGAFAAGEHDAVLAELDSLRAAEARGREPEEAAAPDAAALEAELLSFCDRALPARGFGATDNLFEQGMSSIDLAEIHGLVEAKYPAGLDIKDFFEHPTIRSLAAVLAGRLAARGAAPELARDLGAGRT